MAHAMLGPSLSGIWLSCTPSVRLCENEPKTTSVYADEGSLAHEIGELKLHKAFIAGMPRSTFSGRLKKLQAKELYNAEMLEHTDAYVDLITELMCKNPGAKCYVEVRVDLGMYAPESFGTCDCLIIAPGKLIVVDFKYGKGVPVDAVNNTQMMLYALGAYQKYSILSAFKEIEMVICQPRLDNNSSFTLRGPDLLAWGESIKPIAKMAFDGVGEFVPGTHCRWCLVKTKCTARAKGYRKLEGFRYAMPPILNNDQLGAILVQAEGIVQWVKELKEYALTEVLSGGCVPGWKVVEGKSNRKIVDTAEAVNVLVANGIQEDKLFVRELIAMTAIEKLVGKLKFKELLMDAGLVVKPEGAPTLARDKDSRGEFGSASNDFAGMET